MVPAAVGPRICSTKRGASPTLGDMRAKLLTAICVVAITSAGVVSGSAAETGGTLAVATDVIIARPACVVATVVCSAVFVVALPWAAASKSVKATADTLVTKPAWATFARPIGDLDSLTAD
jgi:hypothetical protein